MTRAVEVTRAWLGRHHLPRPNATGDKEQRGQVLVVGGSAKVPGAVLLAGVAALRAGAGKLQLATVASASIALGVAVPESLVVGLPQTRTGEIAGARAASVLREYVRSADAILVGPGMSSGRSAHGFLAPIIRHLREDAVLVLDAAAILALKDEDSLLHSLGGRAALTPHAGEMAALLEIDKRDVETDAAGVARLAAERFGAVVALKGAESWIAAPDGALHHYSGGTVGLATSGSGDTLAGIVAGLAARGAPAPLAASWAVFLHGSAGRALEKRMGTVGFLARELLDEVPRLMHGLAR